MVHQQSLLDSYWQEVEWEIQESMLQLQKISQLQELGRMVPSHEVE